MVRGTWRDWNWRAFSFTGTDLLRYCHQNTCLEGPVITKISWTHCVRSVTGPPPRLRGEGVAGVRSFIAALLITTHAATAALGADIVGSSTYRPEVVGRVGVVA